VGAAVERIWFSQWLESSSGTDVCIGVTNGLRIRMDRGRVIEAEFSTTNEIRHNDLFVDRQMVLPAPQVVRGMNVNATNETGEPLHHPNQSGRSLWWSWTAERTAPVAISTAGSAFTNVLTVYTGESVGTLTRIAADVGSGGAEDSRVWFNSIAGVTYHLAVDGIGGAAGEISLRLVENEEFTLEFLAPGYNPSHAAPADIPLHLIALNSDLTVTQVNVFTNGTLAARMFQSPYTTTLLNIGPGTYQFDANAIDVYGRTVSVRGVSVPVNLFQFTTNQFFANESTGTASISIKRTTWNTPGMVYVETRSLTAVENDDYVHLAGILRFDPDYNQRTFTIPIAWDAVAETNEMVEIILSSGPGTPIKDRALLTIRNSSPPRSIVWIDDFLPAGTKTNSITWLASWLTHMSGLRAHTSGAVEVFPGSELEMRPDSVLVQDVYLDPDDPPEFISIRWRYNTWYSGWASWGDPRYDQHGSWMGPLPRTGGWVRLTVPGDRFGAIWLQGMEWSASGGHAVWDRTERLWE
jgi:hypothetical protein